MDQAKRREPLATMIAPETWRLIWGAVACWLVINLGPSLASLMQVGPQPGRPSLIPDFFADYASARNVLASRALYSPHEQTLRFYFEVSTPGVPTFRYNVHPPSSVLMALPLARLSFPAAFTAWNLFSLFCIVASLWIIRRGLDAKVSAWSVFPVISLLLVYIPLWDQVRMGQLSGLLLLLLTGAWSALRSGRSILAGTLLALAASIKLFPGFLLLYLLFQKRWRAVAAGLAAMGFIAGLTVIGLGWDAYRSYITEILPVAQWYRALWGNLSLVGFWSRLFESAPSVAVALIHSRPLTESPLLFGIAITASAAAVVVALASVSSENHSQETFDVGYATAIIAMLLLSPVTWSHSLMMLILPVLLLWSSEKSWSGRALLAGLVIVLSIDPKLTWSLISHDGDSPVASPLESLLVASLPCYALVGLFLKGLASASRVLPASPQDRATKPPGVVPV